MPPRPLDKPGKTAAGMRATRVWTAVRSAVARHGGTPLRALIMIVLVGGADQISDVGAPGALLHSPFLAFYPAIAVTTWLGGLAWGLVATLLAAALTVREAAAVAGAAPEVRDIASVLLFTLVGGMVAAGVEVLVRAGEQIGAGAARLRTVFELSSVGLVYAHDRDASRVTVNPALARLLGRPLVPDAPGSRGEQPFSAALDGDQCGELAVPLRQAAHTALPVRDCVIDLAGPGGRPVVLRGDAVPIRDAAGTVIGAVGAFSDVTERTRMESELEKTRARLHVLAEVSARLAASLEYGAASLEEVARVIVPAVADGCLIDLEEDGRLNRVVMHHAHPDKAPLAEALRTKHVPDPARPNVALPALRAGRSLLTETVDDTWCRARALDAEHLQVLRQLELLSVLSVPLSYRGEFLGVLSLATSRDSGRHYTAADVEFAEDLGQRLAGALIKARFYRDAHRERAAAERARTEAEAANRAKDNFLAVLSHELRAPLQGILGWVTLMRRGALDVERTARALQTVERSVRAQAQLVDDLLEVSRIVSGKLELVRVPVALHEVVDAALEQLRPVAAEKGVRLFATRNDCGVVQADAERLQQVITNLLTNAVKFTPAGGEVEIRCEREGDQAVLSVRDTGQGIAPEFLPRLFSRFAQAEGGSTRRYGGLGLGLSIVRHLVERHGGTVEAASPGLDRGATFTVRLPFLARSAPDALVREREAVLPDALTGIEIVLVEDDTDTREALALSLGQSGARVRAVGSAADALSLVATARPALVITDIGMPEHDGFWLLRELQARTPPPPLPVIALTGFASSEDRQRIVAAGFRAHLAKPIDADALVAAAARVLREPQAA